MAERKSDLAFAAFFGSGKSGGGGAAVLYTQQTLTAAQQAQARANIGAVSLDEIGTVFTLKGGVPTVADLPASGNSVGDVYYVEAVSAGYIWLTSDSQPNGYWEELGETFDVTVDSELSATSENPVQNKAIAAALENKADASALNGKVSVAQGTANAGKFLIVGSDGNVSPVAMTAWQGGSY